jgi:hypothetical protein
MIIIQIKYHYVDYDLRRKFETKEFSRLEEKILVGKLFVQKEIDENK